MSSDMQVNGDVRDSNIFIYFVLVVSILIMGILIANTVYFKRIADSTVDNVAISKSEANSMFILNLLFMIPIFGVVLYAVIKLILGSRKYNTIKGMALSKAVDLKTRVKSWANSSPSGVLPGTTGGQVGSLADLSGGQ
jgi:heme/copper-type cytochrome/quinol oxidase subunit 2